MGQSVFAPGAARYTYAYDALGNLQTVTGPERYARRYHYEDPRFPHALTALTDERGVRYATWRYDAQGRAISSEHAGGADKVTFNRLGGGAVAVGNALNKKATHYFEIRNGIARLQRIEKDDAVADAQCPDGDLRYTLDEHGYPRMITDKRGFVSTYAHNARGLEERRTEALGTGVERTVTTVWEAEFPLPDRLTEPGRQSDYDY